MNKNNQTTSTKCQYHAAISNPMWWVWEIFFLIIFLKFTIKNVVPIMTCNPWNPVATKKIEP